jgi:post-segregation antitoxin (ccd killing protein)
VTLLPASSVPLPDTIAVKYTEEEAQYLSIRPLVRQTFRLAELVDMILGVTGKDVARIRQILRSGTVVFHFYRYWWQGFETEEAELRALLAGYPDADPMRPFRAEECAAVQFESGAGAPSRAPLELRREHAVRRRLLHSRSFWDYLMDLAQQNAPVYVDYSYARRADLYALDLSPAQQAALAREARRLSTRALRAQMQRHPQPGRIIFVCPRGKVSP